jgi:hypothetical protein
MKFSMILAAGVLAACAGVAAAQPLTAFGITTGNRLVSFDVNTPGTIAADVAISGLASGENAVSIDARPASAVGEMIILTSANRMYSLNAAGNATLIGTGFTPGLSTLALGMDFNPTVDRIRVVHSNGDNRRLNPLTGGAVQADTALTYNDGSGLIPRAVGTAYDAFQFGAIAPVGSVRQFIIDSARDILGEVGSRTGGNASFNGGIVTPIGALGFDLSDDAGFDVFGPTQTAFISSLDASGTARFFSLNLSTGAATSIGAVGAGISDFTVIPAPGAAAAILGGLAMGLRRRR